ncbi:MAG: cysteine hydrolase [Lachnospiraceae bacterium]|nr:cysteine hydrolase [Lachnospiraceae bacterium]
MVNDTRVKVSRKMALLTTDLQYDLIQKSPEREARVKEILPNIISFLMFLRENDVLIIHQQIICKETDHVEFFNGKIPCIKGTRGAQLVDELKAEKDIVMEKRKDSGFYETELDDVLKANNIDTLLLAGMQAQICIQTTGADAYFRGYNVVAVSDCITSTLESDKQRALSWISGYCGKVYSSKEIMQFIQNDENIEFPVIYTP